MGTLFFHRENLLELNIYFQELNVYFIEQQPAYDFESLLGEYNCLLFQKR